MRDAKDCALVGEVVIVLVLRYRRHEQKGCKRCNHHPDEDKDAALTVHVAGQHLETIAKVMVKVRPRGILPPHQFRGFGKPARMRSEKSGALPAACAVALMSERRRSSSNGSVVSTRPEWYR